MANNARHAGVIGVKKMKIERLRKVADRAADALEEALTQGDVRSLKDTAAALKELVGVTRDVYEIPNAEQRLNLKLLRQKLKSETARGDGEGESGVIQIETAAGGGPGEGGGAAWQAM